MIVCVPLPAGVYVTEHSLGPVAGSVQEPPPEKAPAASLEKLTEPVGRIAVPALVSSATVAVQVEGALTATEAGVQLTVAWLARLVTVSAKVPVLVAWLVLEASS